LPWISVVLLAGLVVVVFGVVLLAGALRSNRETAAVFPLPGRYTGSYENDWGASREQGAHEGTDLYAPRGSPIFSITAGTVASTLGTEDGWNTLGGYAVTVEADAAPAPVEDGYSLYYAHLDAPAGLESGDRVEASQKIGEVGDSGGGPPGTRGRFVTHLHLGWYDGSAFGSRADAPSGAMNPYSLLRRLERDGPTTSVTGEPG
jgi:murein DD-endopeptidase MepM/ murein hydrolase activator NlpD